MNALRIDALQSGTPSKTVCTDQFVNKYDNVLKYY